MTADSAPNDETAATRPRNSCPISARSNGWAVRWPYRRRRRAISVSTTRWFAPADGRAMAASQLDMTTRPRREAGSVGPEGGADRRRALLFARLRRGRYGQFLRCIVLVLQKRRRGSGDGRIGGFDRGMQHGRT